MTRRGLFAMLAGLGAAVGLRQPVAESGYWARACASAPAVISHGPIVAILLVMFRGGASQFVKVYCEADVYVTEDNRVAVCPNGEILMREGDALLQYWSCYNHWKGWMS